MEVEGRWLVVNVLSRVLVALVVIWNVVEKTFASSNSNTNSSKVIFQESYNGELISTKSSNSYRLSKAAQVSFFTTLNALVG